MNIKLGDFQQINKDKFYYKNNNWVSEININNIWYSFGLLIWQMLTIKIPFAELKNGSDDKIKQFLSKHSLSMKLLIKDTPPSLYSLMMILLNKENSYEFLNKKRNDEIHKLIDSIPEENDISKKKFEMSDFYFKINIFAESSSSQELSNNTALIENYENLIELTDYDLPLLKYIGYFFRSNQKVWSLYSQKVHYTLTQYLKDNLVTIEEKRNILIQILDALILIKDKQLFINELNPDYIFVVKQENNNIKIKIGNYGKNLEAVKIVFPNENKLNFPFAIEFREFCLKILNYQKNDNSDNILQKEDIDFIKQTESETLNFDTIKSVINKTWKKIP